MSQNYRAFAETTVMGTENNILWFELDHIIFPDFTGIWRLKYKEIKASGAKLFLSPEYSLLSLIQTLIPHVYVNNEIRSCSSF